MLGIFLANVCLQMCLASQGLVATLEVLVVLDSLM